LLSHTTPSEGILGPISMMSSGPCVGDSLGSATSPGLESGEPQCPMPMQEKLKEEEALLVSMMVRIASQSYRGAFTRAFRDMVHQIDLKGNHILDTMKLVHSPELISLYKSIPDVANGCPVEIGWQMRDVKEELEVGDFSALRKLVKTLATRVYRRKIALTKFDEPSWCKNLLWGLLSALFILVPVLMVGATLFVVLSNPQVAGMLNNATSAVTGVKAGSD